MEKEKSIYELQAEICKILSNPKRVEIINALKEGEKSVKELVKILQIPKSNISQHLSVMKFRGILKGRRDGVNMYYSIANPKIIHACNLIGEALNEILLERSKVAEKLVAWI